MFSAPTIAAHTQSQAFLQPTVLTAVTVGPVDEAVPLPWAGVHSIVLLAAAEETLQTSTQVHQIKLTRWQGIITNTWGGRCDGSPCSLHRWWRRSGSLRIYPHRFYRESLLFELEEKKNEGRSHVIVPVYIRWKYTQHHPVRSLSIPEVIPQHRLHSLPQECNK